MSIAKILKGFSFAKLFPFIKDLKNYNKDKFKRDLIAGLTVAIVGTPQAIAYAVIAGVDPKFGLYTCIVPVIVAALMGSSRFLVAGPTNTVSMVIFSTLSTLSIGGVAVSTFPDEQKIQLVFILSILAGLIQVILGITKMGNLLNFISHSVIVGFTAGAGILIGFNQIKNLLGIHIHSGSHFIESTVETFKHIGQTDFRALFLGLLTIAIIVGFKKFFKKLPGSLIALVTTAMIVKFTGWMDQGLATVGGIPQSLPPISTPHFSLELLRGLIMPAFAIAILGVIEAFSIAKSFSSKSGDKLDGNQEFIGQGLANISAGFSSGIPGTGSFTRSAVNFSSRAATRFAAMFSALMVLFIVLLFANGARYIPIASLAGTLIVIAVSMIDRHAFSLSFHATKADRFVLIATMLATLILHLDQAVYFGVILSVILFMRKISHPQIAQVAPCEENRKLLPLASEQKNCNQISIFQVEGSLFFGAINELEEQLSKYIKNGGRVCIVRMASVRLIDATGVHALESLLREADEKNVIMLFANLKPEVIKVLKKTGMHNKIGRDNFFEHTKDAIIKAVQIIQSEGGCKECKIKSFQECQKYNKK